jgi:hypothetical protein
LAITVKINGIPRVPLAGSLRINKPRGSIHTASFTLLETGPVPYHPTPGEHVVIEEDGDLIFAGQIEEPEEEVWCGPDQAVEIRVLASDYTRLLSHYWVVGLWENATAAQIIADCLTPSNPYCDIAGKVDEDGIVIPSEGIQFTPTYPGITIDRYPCQNKLLLDVISELAAMTDYEWYLDYNKVLYFGPGESLRAPFSISNTSRNFRKLTVKKRLDEYANEVLVLGAVCETDPQFVEYRGDGSTRVFKPTGQEVYNILDVAPNDDYPTGCVLIDLSKPEGDPLRRQDQVVALQGSVEGADWYFSHGSPDLTQGEGKETLQPHHLLRLRYIGEYPIWHLRTNVDAIRERALVEGGAALYQLVEQDATIKSPEVAAMKAESMLRKRSVVPRIVNYQTDAVVEPLCRGLAPGQTQQIQLTRYALGQRRNPSLPDGFMIHRVDIRDVAGKYFVYDVECVGSEKKPWEDAYRKLFQQRQIEAAGGNDPSVTMVRRRRDHLAITDVMSSQRTDGIPWVGSEVGFCECVSNKDIYDLFTVYYFISHTQVVAKQNTTEE